MKIFGKKLPSRKAVSPVIATLLMIAIAVAASILVYVWSIGLIGTLQTGGGEQTKEMLALDAYDWSPVTDNPVLTVRNVGTADFAINKTYLNGVSKAFTAATLAPGATAAITITLGSAPPTITAGVAYTVKFVSASGAVSSFSIIAGRSA